MKKETNADQTSNCAKFISKWTEKWRLIQNFRNFKIFNFPNFWTKIVFYESFCEIVVNMGYHYMNLRYHNINLGYLEINIEHRKMMSGHC